ncbi:helix-turn-helix domain-containing protein [Liquorilactobacillus satsumensis]|uniref:helix-turn-helix transcriptional regulator n=1 Tax=Liquorilactobacillus satsumensis TaxID=259059 RepID=UPI0021C4C04F|nr:helix-turn-helix transcriptional regulator [Liquorilactobacillus satsumensis]MCP9313683.1 helix-turn-helix domain-containing protein [Liquorilactobacillus satsumensis]MCP9327905.1 helix-turn-helix domain-containing protein [Liquorilactobacillus satsumensis]MCP9360831.1 helix-turn-helix domain-containing protein [Liquorilactobacillus satsumensis]
MKESLARYKELGDFLKTRRAKISPSQVGLPVGIRRRTPGLRREEVAALAGIGITWYTWLEQGREIQVSAQVLESLSRVLMLDKAEIRHLYILANQPSPLDIPPQQQALAPMLQRILASLTFSPAIILDTRWNLVAWNTAARVALFDFDTLAAEDLNCVWLMFTNSQYKKRFTNWEVQAQGLIARFRAECSKYIEDPWVTKFVRQLQAASPEFAEWWSMHNVAKEREYYKTFNHPTAGKLIFEHTSFFVAANMNLKLFINAPAPGTETEYKMKNLIAML